MAEPQPSNVHEGASTPPPPTGTAEDRKAAAALSSLDARDDDASSKANTDAAALGEAMKNLGVGDKAEAPKSGKAEEVKKMVKVDVQDVALLVSALFDVELDVRERGRFRLWDWANLHMQVEQLELSKVKATELLKAHEGDAVKALTAFVTTSA
jgi:hypothetical protein